MKYGIAYEDIYNFNEIGSAMGLIATARVVTRAETVDLLPYCSLGIVNGLLQLRVYWVLMLWDGLCFYAFIVFKGKSHIQAWYEDDALPHDWWIELSENEWTTDQIGLS